MKHCKFCSGIFDKYVTNSVIYRDYMFSDGYYSTFIDYIKVKANILFDGVNIRIINYIYPEKCIFKSEYSVEMDGRVRFSFFTEKSFTNYMNCFFKNYDNSEMMDQIKKKDTKSGLDAWINLLHDLTPFEFQHSRFDADHLSLKIYPLGVKVCRAGECKAGVRWRIFSLSDNTGKNGVAFDEDLQQYISSGTIGI